MPKCSDSANGMEEVKEASSVEVLVMIIQIGQRTIMQKPSVFSSRSRARNLMTKITYAEFQQSAIPRERPVI